jgi:hypothetical protein
MSLSTFGIVSRPTAFLTSRKWNRRIACRELSALSARTTIA